ncbi:MAG: hypothetical protein AAGH15_10585, partial [Myxococcota bacterium]
GPERRAEHEPELGGGVVEAPPAVTALGALRGHLRTPRDDFQPSNVVWSMFPPLDPPYATTPKGKRRKLGKRERREAKAARALEALPTWLRSVGVPSVEAAE